MRFLRRQSARYSKLGRKRKDKQIWRKPTGRHNKMREQKRGLPKIVKIGYKEDKRLRGKFNNKTPKLIMNLNDLGQIKATEIGLLGKVGKKKKIEIAKKAKEKKIEIYNLNADKFLKQMEKIKNESKS